MDPETGDRPSQTELWRMTHQRSNGTWADEKSKNAHEEMMNLLSQPQPSQSGEGLVDLTLKEAFVRVIGERSGHARGLGCGPRGATTSKNHSQEQIEQMLKERNEFAQRITHLEETFDARVQAAVEMVKSRVNATVKAAIQAALAKFKDSSD
ncbi:uncharacterized protein LOC119995827 [Tripterygium wilfordii]|uniref:uncharacterized protein LOC119995827 n=1 Tax=Tripterygium wilfordii TaxID=458696 RepID=UPI0018F7F2FD|nr:uncharacterized protein LOC119995827 [Tripterygium wilfordii]